MIERRTKMSRVRVSGARVRARRFLNGAGLVAVLAAVLSMMGQVVAFADSGGKAGRASDVQQESEAEGDGGAIAWEGNGSDQLPCDGAHWILAPAFGIESATLTVNGSAYTMSQSGNGSWWADSSGVIDGSVSAFVTFTGDGDPRNHLQLSHCLAMSTTPPETTPPETTPPETTPPETTPPETTPPQTTPPQTTPPETTPPETTPPETETKTKSASVVGTKVKSPPATLAFTGPEAVIPLGALSLSLFMIGSGLMWAGARLNRRIDENAA